MLAGFCLLIALALLALSTLVFRPAPTMGTFPLAVGATELGHWFALAALAVALAAPKSDPVGMAAAGLAGIAFAFFLVPAVRAARNAWRLQAALRALGEAPPVFSWRRLFCWPERHRPEGKRMVADGVGFDFYRARGRSAAPLVVVVHGGGWMAGAADELAGWNRWLAARGVAVAAVEYTLVPGAVWPRQRDEVRAVIAHVRAEAAVFGVDPSRVVLLGRSAGGQIASALAALPGQPWLRGCVCLYAPFDLEFAYTHGREDDVLRSRWLLRSYLGGTPEEVPAAYREASAYAEVRADAPPFLLLHGGRDELVWRVQTERFAARLAERGVEHVFLELPWATHAFDYNLHGPGGQVFAAAITAFLARTCGTDAMSAAG